MTHWDLNDIKMIDFTALSANLDDKTELCKTTGWLPMQSRELSYLSKRTAHRLQRWDLLFSDFDPEIRRRWLHAWTENPNLHNTIKPTFGIPRKHLCNAAKTSLVPSGRDCCTGHFEVCTTGSLGLLEEVELWDRCVSADDCVYTWLRSDPCGSGWNSFCCCLWSFCSQLRRADCGRRNDWKISKATGGTSWCSCPHILRAWICLVYLSFSLFGKSQNQKW